MCRAPVAWTTNPSNKPWPCSADSRKSPPAFRSPISGAWRPAPSAKPKTAAEFCRRAKDEIGIDVEIISGETEARLAFISVQRAFDLTGKNVVVADIGGGSTEFVIAGGNAIEAIYSTPIGTVRLTEQYGSDPHSVPGKYESLLEGIDTLLRKHAGKVALHAAFADRHRRHVHRAG
ncbi:MAG: hypothetical protein QM811_28190 [Pirellulales bacterium]